MNTHPKKRTSSRTLRPHSLIMSPHEEHILQVLEHATAPEESMLPMPGALLVFAHPDDEVIALGARIRRFREAHWVHVTDGAPRSGQDSRDHGFATPEAYRRARHGEFRNALRQVGLSDISYECLAIPDQEAALRLNELSRTMALLIEAHSPQVVFTHPYEGGHPDHDACAFAVHQAVRDLAARDLPAPVIAEASFYHAGPHGIETGCFPTGSEPGREKVYPLSDREQRQKRQLLRCFTTQQSTLQFFGTAEERFRIAPGYNFTGPPAESVFYDRYAWGMSSQRFCELAAETMRTRATEATRVRATEALSRG